MSELNKMRRKMNALGVYAKIRDREKNHILSEFIDIREKYNLLVEKKTVIMDAISCAESEILDSESQESLYGLAMREFKYEYLDRLYRSHNEIERDLNLKEKEKSATEEKYRIADAKSNIVKNQHQKEEVKFRSTVLAQEERNN